MLSAWAMNYGRLKKRLAWVAYQRRDLNQATAFHATSAEEAEEIRALGFQQPIAVIPNGIDFPSQIDPKPSERQKRTMLFLSRIHPKKGLLSLVRAWKHAGPGTDWRLVIAGPDEDGHRSVIEQTVQKLKLQDQVSFPGEIKDDDKWALYSQADVFVLPSFSENFGLVVAESLAAGTPVITTTGTPWRELGEHGCGWQVEPTVEALTAAIQQAVRAPDDALAAMGERGAKWVRRQFQWTDVGRSMIEYYRWLLKGGTPPPSVHLAS
jgi:glycosyltransferase involved in cell wall biosynthesis